MNLIFSERKKNRRIIFFWGGGGNQLKVVDRSIFSLILVGIGFSPFPIKSA
jgi:hypothetical protein